MTHPSPIRKHTLVVGPFQCNCSVLICEKTREAIVIDPGDELPRIRAYCEKQSAMLKYAVHTHAHLDHIGAAGELKAWSPATKLCLHRDDEWLFQNLVMQGQLFGLTYAPPPPVDYFMQDAEELRFGEQSFEVLHTPGHSPGGVCLAFKAGALAEEPVLFSGDTLFQLSIGRTDLWGGDHRLLLKSIRDRLLTRDVQTRVFPGHGEATTIGVEARENPFL